MKIHWELEQRSPAWFEIRSGVPTASEFDSIITPAKGNLSEARWSYMCRLIAQKLLNWQPKQLDTEDIRNGIEREPGAVRYLEFMHDIQTRKVGFVTRDDGLVGASPDRFVMPSMRPLEVKCPSNPVHVEYLLIGPGAKYAPQVQGQMYVCEADEAVFFSYNPHATAQGLIRTHRDDVYIAKLVQHLDQFTDELGMLLDKAKALGLGQAFADAVDEDVPGLVEADPGMAEAIAKAGGE